VSEQGDTKRSIGIYGITINIASRMEEAAKAHRVLCAISGDVAQELSDAEDRLYSIGSEKIKGISAELPIFQYRIAGEPVAVAVEETAVEETAVEETSSLRSSESSGFRLGQS